MKQMQFPTYEGGYLMNLYEVGNNDALQKAPV